MSDLKNIEAKLNNIEFLLTRLVSLMEDLLRKS